MSALSYFNEPAPLAWEVAAAIFGATGEGGLYDPSALDTLFQDANGTTPAVPGSPVGLVLDKSRDRGLDIKSSGVTKVIGTVSEPPTYDPATGVGSLRREGSAQNASTLDFLDVGADRVFAFDIEHIGGSETTIRVHSVTGGDGIVQHIIPVGERVTVLVVGFPSYMVAPWNNNQATQFRIHSVREIPGNHLSQPTTAARPILARMPLTGRRNLLVATEDFNNPAWLVSNSNIVVAPSPDPKFPGAWRVTASGTGITWHRLRQDAGSGKSLRYCAVKAVTGRYIGIDITTAIINAVATTAVFDTVTGMYVDGLPVRDPSTNTSGALPVINLGDGWWGIGAFRDGNYRFSLRLMNGPSLESNSDFEASGESFLVAEPQVTSDILERVPYQRVTNAYDVTEAGVPDTYSLVYDLADDALTTTLPQAVNGDILIAGTRGTIIEPVSYAAESTFTIGPDTYTGGTPGILRAIGDIVGVLLIDRTLTQTERDTLIEHYKGKGAKGLLVPGPELVVNGTFDVDLSDWTDASGEWFWEDGAACIINPTATSRYITQSVTGAVIGATYLVGVDAEITVGLVETRLGASATPAGISTFSSGSGKSISQWSGISETLLMRYQRTSGEARVNSVSVRELRPQEDWT